MANEKEKEIIETMRERFRLMLEADQENRRKALDDFKFVYEDGWQWDENMLKNRGNRPAYTFNKIRVTCKRIINEMRSNRPQAKVRPVEGGDQEVAEIIEGLCRNIENTSDFDTVTDYAAEYQVGAGYGAWRIVTEYADDNMFEQDIEIQAIQNPFCLFSDPSSRDPMKRDARDWILTERMSRVDFEEQYGDKDIIEFESHEFDDDEEWQDADEVRLAEYWYKEPVTKEIWQLADGTVIDSESDEAAAIDQSMPGAIVKRREVKTHKIMMVLATGDAILEGPTEWAGKHFPFVPVYGEYMVIDGATHWYGAARFAKDAQRSYNISRTAVAESIAMQPQSKYWVTAKQAEGHQEKWAVAHAKNFPFLLYNPDPQSPGPPSRMGTADVPVALINESQLAAEEINMVTGIYQSDVGAPNAASSGRQEIARQQMGAVATYNYQDNMAKGMRRTTEILIDLIPKIYDTERELRIIGSDGAEDYKTVNKFAIGENDEPIKINDLSMGRYDTTVTVGPSFSTRRQEAAETYQHLLQGNPQVFPVIGDLIFKSMDLPYSEDIAERLRVMLPPEIQATMNEDANVPPEVRQMMQQAQQAMQMVEAKAMEVQEQANEADLAKSEVEKLMAQLQTQQARFEAQVAEHTANVAKDMAQIAQKDARLTEDKVAMEATGIIDKAREEVAAQVAQFNEALANDTADVLESIQKISAQLADQAVGVVSKIAEERDTRPAVREVVFKRENGVAKAVPVYDE